MPVRASVIVQTGIGSASVVLGSTRVVSRLRPLRPLYKLTTRIGPEVL